MLFLTSVQIGHEKQNFIETPQFVQGSLLLLYCLPYLFQIFSNLPSFHLQCFFLACFFGQMSVNQHLLSLGTLVPQSLVRWYLSTLLFFLQQGITFTVDLTHGSCQHFDITHKHREQQTDTQTYRYILTSTTMCLQQLSVLY